MSSAKNGVCLDLTTKSSSRLSVQTKYSFYKQGIKRQSQLMQCEFNRLLLKTIREFTKSVPLRVAIDKLRNLIIPRDTRNPLYGRIYKTKCKHLKKLNEVSTYGELQEYLIRNYCAWFNIDLIADLRRVLLDYGENDPTIVEYEAKVVNYLRKCCYTGRSYSFCTEIVCEASTDFRTVKDHQMERFQKKLQQILHITECECRVDEGSGKLILFVERMVWLYSCVIND